MTEHEASRTLVKSPPELWSECSDPDALARHLNGSFGEIRITRLDPESTVAWEGESTSGTVRIEPSGWGTRVTLKVSKALRTAPEPQPEIPPAPEPPPEPEPEPLPPAARERSRVALRWLKTFFLGEDEPEQPAAADLATPPASVPQPGPGGDPELQRALDGALESLGQAHHRPFSRA